METFSALLALCVGNSPVPVTSPHKCQWRGALMFSLIYARINDWVNNREAGDVRRQRGHYDVIVMYIADTRALLFCLDNLRITRVPSMSDTAVWSGTYVGISMDDVFNDISWETLETVCSVFFVVGCPGSCSLTLLISFSAVDHLHGGQPLQWPLLLTRFNFNTTMDK